MHQEKELGPELVFQGLYHVLLSLARYSQALFLTGIKETTSFRGVIFDGGDAVYSLTEGPMPTYVYCCQECGKNFERTEHIAQHESMKHRCPKCKSTKITHAISPFFAKAARKS
jgi:putative FmdB family regulatory protein